MSSLNPPADTELFLIAAASTFPRSTLRGWDINQSYVEAAAAALKQTGRQSVPRSMSWVEP